MDEIMEEIKKTLVPSLRINNMLLENNHYIDTGISEDYCLAEIPDFQSLLPQSHKFGKPVFALRDDEIERSGTVLDQMIIKRDQFNQQFNEFAEIIEHIKDNAVG